MDIQVRIRLKKAPVEGVSVQDTRDSKMIFERTADMTDAATGYWLPIGRNSETVGPATDTVVPVKLVEVCTIVGDADCPEGAAE